METDHWQHAFEANEYLILESVLTEPLRTVAHEYAIKRALLTRETTSAGAAPGTPSFYGDPLMDTLLDLLQSVAETFTGLALFPTFSDLRVYARGAIVNPHTQRPAGEIALSVSLGFEAPKPWPFFLGTRKVNMDDLKAKRLRRSRAADTGRLHVFIRGRELVGDITWETDDGEGLDTTRGKAGGGAEARRHRPGALHRKPDDGPASIPGRRPPLRTSAGRVPGGAMGRGLPRRRRGAD